MVCENVDWAQIVCDAFAAIEDKNALAWSVLDAKSESAVVRSVALQINRCGSGFARVEYPPRIDLVLLHNGDPKAAFEAKSAYLSDFQRQYVAKRNWYLGPYIDDDIQKFRKHPARYSTLDYCAALFFLYEVDDTTKQLKYGRTLPVNRAEAESALTSSVIRGGDWFSTGTGPLAVEGRKQPKQLCNGVGFRGAR